MITRQCSHVGSESKYTPVKDRARGNAPAENLITRLQDYAQSCWRPMLGYGLRLLPPIDGHARCVRRCARVDSGTREHCGRSVCSVHLPPIRAYRSGTAGASRYALVFVAVFGTTEIAGRLQVGVFSSARRSRSRRSNAFRCEG